jgi:hypothetical protein
MHTIANSISNYQSADCHISLSVQPIAYGHYGVYASAVLIASHLDQASADAHCQRIRNEQAPCKSTYASNTIREN